MSSVSEAEIGRCPLSVRRLLLKLCHECPGPGGVYLRKRKAAAARSPAVVPDRTLVCCQFARAAAANLTRCPSASRLTPPSEPHADHPEDQKGQNQKLGQEKDWRHMYRAGQ